jgi:NADP-dependent 3-hydroxy acid dehydrogenase YdfG
MDLNAYGIKVTSINPGLVETEFALVRFKGDEEKASNVYKGMKPLVAEDIADIIRYTLMAPDHVVLADITVFPKAQASSTQVKRN